MPAGRCDKVLLVQAEFDGELDAAAAVALAAHRVTCPVCTAAAAELVRTRALLRTPGLYQPLPEAARTRLLDRIAAARPPLSQIPPPAPPRALRWWRPAFGGFGLGAAMAAGLVLLILMPAPQQGLVDQVVAGHIRALQPGHLEDVASTDRHTVKPWFDGRLDFAPPVKDLAADGFPLKGGRLDYIGGRAVAALVYQRDKHVIDLFVWPVTAGAPPAPSAAHEHGYNTVRWIADGMSLWAVSDVEPAQLQDFAAFWQAAP